MPADFELTFLGTSTSVGVPVIGCPCDVCSSDDPRNQRTRSSIHLRAGQTQLLVDSGPDLREQALREKLTRIDAVLYTHSHLDHVVGFDELRAFCWRRDAPLPMHGSRETLDALRRMFAWAFSPENVYGGYIKPEAVELDGPITFGNLKVTPLPVVHGSVETHGFLFEFPGHPAIAYISDAKEVPSDTRDLIQNVDILVIDALREKPHPTHMSVAESLATIDSIGATKAWLTHLGHENDHVRLESKLPSHVRVAHDGLRLPDF